MGRCNTCFAIGCTTCPEGEYPLKGEEGELAEKYLDLIFPIEADASFQEMEDNRRARKVFALQCLQGLGLKVLQNMINNHNGSATA